MALLLSLEISILTCESQREFKEESHKACANQIFCGFVELFVQALREADNGCKAFLYI
jgi:hypothetical protein